MDKIIIAFRSRSDTLGFADYVKKRGGFVKIVNTPKEAGVGCGLSVETSARFLTAIKTAVRDYRAKSFAGIFAVNTKMGKTVIKAV